MELKATLMSTKDIELKCGDCSTPLVKISIIQTNKHREEKGLRPVAISYVVTKCYKCGGSSFKTEPIEGTTIVETVLDEVELSVDQAEKDGILTYKIITKRIKNGTKS